jgi:hypothetical protein
MELKDFIKKVLSDLVASVEEVRMESNRDMHLTSTTENRTVATSASGKAGIKVFQIIEGGGNMQTENKNSSVSRIKFGVYIDTLTKEEDAQHKARIASQFNRNNTPDYI